MLETDDASIDAFEAAIEAFERAWRLDQAPPLRRFLEDPAVRPAVRAALLYELLRVDLEYRWRNSDAACADRRTLDDYLRLLPELGRGDDLPIDLIAEEYRVRRRRTSSNRRWSLEVSKFTLGVPAPPHSALTVPLSWSSTACKSTFILVNRGGKFDSAKSWAVCVDAPLDVFSHRDGLSRRATRLTTPVMFVCPRSHWPPNACQMPKPSKRGPSRCGPGTQRNG
jgi:hypothetical protein